MRICRYAARRYIDTGHVALWFGVIRHSAVAFVFISDVTKYWASVSWSH